MPERKLRFIRRTGRPQFAGEAGFHYMTGELVARGRGNENGSHLGCDGDRLLLRSGVGVPPYWVQAARFLRRRSPRSSACRMAPRRWMLRATTASAT